MGSRPKRLRPDRTRYRSSLLHSTVLEPTVDRTEQPHASDAPAPQKATSSGVRTNPIFYVLAVVCGLFSGWVNEKVDDALLTALCVLFFTMMLGTWKKQRPWRWMLLVWIGVPAALAYYNYVGRWPHDRGQVYGAFLQLLSASAGANGGHYMRDMIDHVFLKHDG